MKLIIGNDKLNFLEDACCISSAKFPINVINAAFIKYDLLKAVPTFTDLEKWRSLGFITKDHQNGSISLGNRWRMFLQNDGGNQVLEEVILLNIGRCSDE